MYLACMGMTGTIYTLKPILKGEGRGVGSYRDKESEGVRGRHIPTQTCY